MKRNFARLVLFFAVFSLLGCSGGGIKSNLPVTILHVGTYRTTYLTKQQQEETVIIIVAEKDGVTPLLLQETHPSKELKEFIKLLRNGNKIHFKTEAYSTDEKRRYDICEIIDMSTGAVFRKK